MPEYEYRCKKCEQIFSVERSMTDSSAVHCTQCNSADLARIWQANFIGTTSKSNNGQAQSKSEACASNPAVSKSCCPCG